MEAPVALPSTPSGRGLRVLALGLVSVVVTACAPEKVLVAHRGASAYAPEHTLDAYRLAIEQGADFIEPDLQITRDGILIALHDLTLERTTNVEQVFPDRYREERVDEGGRAGDPDGIRTGTADAGGNGRDEAREGGSDDAGAARTVRRWYAADFTLDEIRELDAGSWFAPDFAGSRIPTLDEVIELALDGGVGIFPETKAPEVYGAMGFEMERVLLDALAEYGLQEPGAVPGTPVIIQSFSPESLRILRHEMGTALDLTLLVSAPDREGWLSPEGLRRAAGFATGIGPSKRLLEGRPDIVEESHRLDLTVIPYTFRSDDPGDFSSGTAEQAHYLYELNVDGLFTNNPDHFPRTPPAAES